MTSANPPASLPPLPDELAKRLARFVDESAFGAQGATITDLDGTVVFETQGTTLLLPEVEQALAALYALGRPLIINTLRFPLSVLRTFGADWYRISNAPIPTITLNGSHLGLLRQRDDGALEFEELQVFLLTQGEVEAAMDRVATLVEAGINDVLLFCYGRDWQQGETIWTPVPDRVEATRSRFPSASTVVSSDVEGLRAQLAARELCMLCLLLDADDDVLMAYQQRRGSTFITHDGVNKLSGTIALADRLGVDLSHSIGAGDTEMDRFLSAVGLSLHVGPVELAFRALSETIRLRDARELANVLSHLVHLEQGRRGRAPNEPSA